MTIHAPYNFVPLSPFVHSPEWAEQVSHDVPFKDGLCGSLDVELENHTPLLVGGWRIQAAEKKPGEVYFCKDPKGRHFIPGSTFKGMLRNVVEIAGFGKMQAVDDIRLSVRDLTGGAKQIYRDNLNANGGPKPGWLRLSREKGETCWELTPCDMARVDQDDLIDLAPAFRICGARDIKEEGSAKEKYLKWENNLKLSFNTYKKITKDKYGNEVISRLMAGDLGQGNQIGTLVFTGQPQTNTGPKGKGQHRPKYLEFVFFDEKKPEPLPNAIIQDFLNIHRDTKEWKFWKSKTNENPGIPVFYIEDGYEQDGYKQVKALGLAMMFRLAYNHSTHQMIRHTSPDHFSREPDLAELLFGFVDSVQEKDTNPGPGSLRGRVSCGAAVADGPVREAETKEVILANPKPSYFPSYVAQPHANPQGNVPKNRYHSYMDDQAQISGWKRYPAQEITNFNLGPQHLLPKTKKVFSKLHPIEDGHRFRCKIKIHNLKPEELGALVWAIHFGEKPDSEPKRFHGMGMGKPFGMGRVSLRIKDHQLIANHGGTPPSLETCLEAFSHHMEEAYQAQKTHGSATWATSSQLKNLIAMAQPRPTDEKSPKPVYMNVKEYQAKKGPKKNSESWSLPPVIANNPSLEREMFPQRSKEEQAQRLQQFRKKKALRLEAEKREADRQRQLAAMSPLDRNLAEKGVEYANGQISKLATLPAKEATAVARSLEIFFTNRKLTHKTKEKLNTIRKYL